MLKANQWHAVVSRGPKPTNSRSMPPGIKEGLGPPTWPLLSEAQLRQLLLEMRCDADFCQRADQQALLQTFTTALAKCQGLPAINLLINQI